MERGEKSNGIGPKTKIDFIMNYLILNLNQIYLVYDSHIYIYILIPFPSPKKNNEKTPMSNNLFLFF